MGGGGREFKTLSIINGPRRQQAEACIANAAAIVIHRLVRALAAEADNGTSDAAPASCRYRDFQIIARYEIDDVFLHRQRLH